MTSKEKANKIAAEFMAANEDRAKYYTTSIGRWGENGCKAVITAIDNGIFYEDDIALVAALRRVYKASGYYITVDTDGNATVVIYCY